MELVVVVELSRRVLLDVAVCIGFGDGTLGGLEADARMAAVAERLGRITALRCVLEVMNHTHLTAHAFTTVEAARRARFGRLPAVA